LQRSIPFAKVSHQRFIDLEQLCTRHALCPMAVPQAAFVQSKAQDNPPVALRAIALKRPFKYS
jgi:hypothetical protein